jgi:hypothetical protein
MERWTEIHPNQTFLFQVEVCMYKGKFRVPFKAEFKYGFPPDFDNGTNSWQVDLLYLLAGCHDIQMNDTQHKKHT